MRSHFRAGLSAAVTLVSAFGVPAIADAHQEPPICTQTLVVAEIVLKRPGHVDDHTGDLSECEFFSYWVRLRKGLPTAEFCAFVGGQVEFTLPDGSKVIPDQEIPCIGGDVGACDRDFFDLFISAWTVSPDDVSEGQIHVSAAYSGGVTHNTTSDTPGVGALASKSTSIVFCDDGDLCTNDVCKEEEPAESACLYGQKYCEDVDDCTIDGCDSETGECTFLPEPACTPVCGDNVLQVGEECDDGGTVGGDRCSAVCTDEVCGDANDDGDISSTDALIALRTAVGSDDCPLTLCDATGNNDVASSDALAILKVAIGLTAPLFCGPP